MTKNLSHKKNRGFTLAEVLITLAIIGVVAALTIPSVITNYKKHITVTRLKRAYSDLNQALKLSEAKYGDMNNWNWNLNGNDFFNKYFSNYIKVEQTSLGNEHITYYQPSGQVENAYYAMTHADTIVIKTSSGYKLLFPNAAWDDGRDIFIDINGDKKPNTFGKDVFVFLLVKRRKAIVPSAWDDGNSDKPISDRNKLKNGPSAHRYQCNKNSRGGWCAALIMLDGWQIKDDYPW